MLPHQPGRQLAQQRGVPILGLLGVVLIAKRARFIQSARALLDQLDRDAGMYLGETLKNTALKTVGE